MSGVDPSNTVMVADMNVTTLRPTVNLVNILSIKSVQCEEAMPDDELDFPSFEDDTLTITFNSDVEAANALNVWANVKYITFIIGSTMDCGGFLRAVQYLPFNTEGTVDEES